MREILFKAKRKDYKKLPREQWWVEGLLTIQWKNLCIQDSNNDNTYYFIDKETICQYTGLTDKNGRKIWENDILRGHGNDEDLAKVVFGEFKVIDVETLEAVESGVGWHTEVVETDALSKCEPFCLPMPLTEFYIRRSEFEVIGNVFDNADLLEVEY